MIKSNRPDGTDIARYKKVDEWTYKRWAWEFLRRNDEFIKSCEGVESEVDIPNAKLQIAADFGLRRYKSYRQGFNTEEEPKFVNTTAVSWSNINKDNDELFVDKILEKGQVMILFDLNPMVVDPFSMKRQLQFAEERLKLRLKSFTTLHQKKLSPVQMTASRPNAVNYLLHLRFLDACNAGMKHAQFAELVFPTKTKYMETTEKNELVKDIAKAARKSAKIGYRNLAVLRGVPKAKIKIEGN